MTAEWYFSFTDPRTELVCSTEECMGRSSSLQFNHPSQCGLGFVLFLLVTLTNWLSAVALSDNNDSALAFARIDANSDGAVSILEHIDGVSKNRTAIRRNHELFDFDGDGSLSPGEFAAIPGVAPPHERAAVPDPFDHLLEQAVTAMDVTYNNWDERPEATTEVSTFVTEFLRSLSPDQSIRLSPALLNQADTNGDRRVSRQEAHEFLEHQLGIRSPKRSLLRQSNGRILNWGRYQWLDDNGDGEITAEEYAEKYAKSPGALANFEPGDEDADGSITWDEFQSPRWRQAWDDPIHQFIRADADFDGVLSPEELEKAARSHQQSLAGLMIPAFDDDGDGALSLDEYRVSMLGNPISGWHTARTDDNRDGILTFDEFLFNQQDFLLLQRLYFFRFDTDGDGRLVQSEFPYIEQNPNTLYRLAADGSSMEILWRDKSLPNGGSPEISPDGEWIAFDLYPNRKLMLVRSDGSDLKELRDGLMPSWSADGRRFAFSRSGVSIYDIESEEFEEFANGWGAQWSPDGKSIAFTMRDGLWVHDVASGENREVLPKASHPYSNLYYGMAWSPDSRFVALKAINGTVNDIIRVDTQSEDPAFEVVYSTTLSLSHDLSWSPDGTRLIFALRSPEHGRNLLHQLELTPGASPELFPGIDTTLTYLNQSYSRDGTWVVLTAK